MDLNVGLVLDSPARGGVEQHVRQLAIGLRSRGLKVTLFCTDLPAHDRLAMAAKAADVEVQRSAFVTPNTVSMRLAGLLVHAHRCIRLARLLRARDVQVMHAHVPGFAGARWSIAAAKLASVPTVVLTVHTAPLRRQPRTTRVERRLLNCIVDGYVAVSHATRNDQIRHLGQSCAKTVVIHNGVELERYASVPGAARDTIRARFGIPTQAPVIGSVGRLSPDKGGASYLISAIPHILASVPDLHILLVGDGVLREALRQHAHSLEVAHRVHFAGYQSDVPSYLSAMDVFVLSSLAEALPLAVLEAQAANLPVIVTNIGGIPEIIENDVNGLLVAPADVAGLAQAVIQLVEHPEQRAALARAGRLSAQRFSTETFITRTISLYKALGRGARTSPHLSREEGGARHSSPTCQGSSTESQPHANGHRSTTRPQSPGHGASCMSRIGTPSVAQPTLGTVGQIESKQDGGADLPKHTYG